MRRVRPLALLLASAAACQLATDFTLAPVAETTEELCADGRDNDFNGLGDCQDWSCQGTLRCCDIPELLLVDDFAGGPACADAACAGQTCASPTCGPDAEQWATWPCPFAKVCDGALHFDKEECFAAGAVSEKSVALTPGLLVEVQLRGAPELRGWLEVALTLQDREDLVGSLNPCGVQQKVNGFAAVRQVHDPAGWKLVASFQQVDVGTSWLRLKTFSSGTPWPMNSMSMAE